jgi:hypothetical protein
MATVAYFDRHFQPTTKDKADFADVHFDDGSAIVTLNLKGVEIPATSR